MKKNKFFANENKNLNHKSGGFTLIELLVVVSIFALTISIIIGLFISIIREQKRTLSQQELLNQVSYAVEYMSRSLRMAKKDITGGCLGKKNLNYAITSEGNGIKFINHSNNDICQEFFWDTNDKKLKEIKNNGTPLSLVSDNLKVNYFKIMLSGALDSDSFQPRVTIFLEVQIRGMGDQPKKQIQTTISQRNLDI